MALVIIEVLKLEIQEQLRPPTGESMVLSYRVMKSPYNSDPFGEQNGAVSATYSRLKGAIFMPSAILFPK